MRGPLVLGSQCIAPVAPAIVMALILILLEFPLPIVELNEGWKLFYSGVYATKSAQAGVEFL